MTLLTRTGLLEGRRRPVGRRDKGKEAQVDVAPLCQAAPYSLRPLAALLNPYARGCSVLCNHPADTQSRDARDALRRAKDTWPTERVLAGEDALPEELFRRYTDTDSRPHSPPHHGHHGGHHGGLHHHPHAPVPLLPPPSLVAPPPTAGTTTGAGARRCRTPDPYHPYHLDLQPQQPPGQPQRTLLVLDLRRSRSHDTLSVAAASESGIWPPPQPAPSMMVSPPSPNEAPAGRRPGAAGHPSHPLAHAPGQRRTPRTPCPSLAASRPASQATCRASSRAGSRLARPSSQPSSPSPGSERRGRGKLQTAASVGGELMMGPEQSPLAASSPLPLALPGADSTPDVVVTCADDSLSREEEEVVRRRGKKRRGKKSGKDGLRELDKEIHGFPEPGETQVSAIGDESHNPSARPSLTGACLLASGGSMGAAYGQGVAAARAAAQEAARLRAVARSFLDADSITHLQRDLDLETVECEFDEKRRVALEEAFRLLPSHAKRRIRDRVRADEPPPGVPGAGGAGGAPPQAAEAPDEDGAARGGLLAVPRVFSLRSARFELPLNSAALNSLTPMEYVSRHVEVCGSSAQLYRRVFNLHREGGGAAVGVPAEAQPQQPQTQQAQQVQQAQLQPPPDVLADLDDEPRYLRGERVVAALGDVLGRPLTADEAEGLRARLGWADEEHLGFRTWCGVSALAERLFAYSQCQSPDVADLRQRVGGAEPAARPELEQADLAGLQRRLARLNPDPRLVKILVEMSEL